MGIKGRRIKKDSAITSKYKEPELLRNIEDVIKVARENGLYTEDKLDIEALINVVSEESIKDYNVGINIIKKDLPPAVSGMLFYQNNIWIMAVNKNHNTKRQRFTLAHELGHFILHKNKMAEFTDTTFFRKKEDNDSLEYNANEFAARILMPKDRVNFYIKDENIRSIRELADKFGVSSAAMRFRVEALGYKVKNG